jgi:hypothetical protein
LIEGTNLLFLELSKYFKTIKNFCKLVNYRFDFAIFPLNVTQLVRLQYNIILPPDPSYMQTKEALLIGILPPDFIMIPCLFSTWQNLDR